MKKAYAVLSDIHGNRWALEAVLTDIQSRRVRHLINLGDIFYGPLDPKGTAAILKKLGMATVKGNGERIICETGERSSPYLSLSFVISQLTDQDKNWLRQLPRTRIIDDGIFLCHGTPSSDSEYLLERIENNLVTLRSPQEIETLVAAADFAMIVCGHSHVAKTVCLPDGRMIVNAGSVGLPAYSEDSPQFHKMENGCPHASYTILKKAKNGWNIEHVQVSYDWEKAARRAELNGRKDWAQWLRTGRA